VKTKFNENEPYRLGVNKQVILNVTPFTMTTKILTHQKTPGMNRGFLIENMVECVDLI
jgi:hypothetical protein